MKVHVKFIFYIVCIHTIALVLSYVVFEKNWILFLVSEFIILLSVAVSWSLYRSLIRPLQLLVQGAEAIQDRDFTVRLVPSGAYEMDQLIGVYNKMIDHLRAERTLQEEQHFFLEKLIQTSPTGIIILDFDNHVHAINPKAADILGIRDGQLLADHPFLKPIIDLPIGAAQMLQSGGIRKYKIQKAQFIDRGFPRAFVTLEELTEEILEAEKTAYGKVIRLMAHEVNNSIGAINSIIDTVRRQPEGAPLRAGDLQAMHIAYERNERLSRFMRRFADVIRLPAPNKVTFDLHDLLRDVGALMAHQLEASGIRLENRFAEGPFYLTADKQQMEQALINIIKNAAEAIAGAGEITLVTSLHPRKLQITDTGTGITPEVASRLFSPFFTTKAQGQGVGLTLIRDIFNNHGFDFSLYSEEGGRTVFEVRV